jgi:hypothetical protein
MTKENVIQKVQDSLGSLFTKDDVINCINLVEEPKVEQVNPMQVAYPNKYWLDKIRNGILERIRDTDFNDSDNFEIKEAEFSIRYGNTIELDSYEVDGSPLQRYIENEIEDFFGIIEDDIIELQQEKEEDERLNSNEALKEAIED